MSAGQTLEPPPKPGLLDPDRAKMRDDAREACASWSSNSCHLDNSGNYRLRNGKIAPWNRNARRVFRDCDELHSVSHKLPADRDRWIEARLLGVDTLRINRCALYDARRALQDHARLIAAAIDALGPRVKEGGPVTVLDEILCLIEGGWRPNEPWAEVSVDLPSGGGAR